MWLFYLIFERSVECYTETISLRTGCSGCQIIYKIRRTIPDLDVVEFAANAHVSITDASFSWYYFIKHVGFCT